MERQGFEESFKDAFKDAEVAPSDSLWTNIELDLEKSSGGDMKKKLLFFQLLAAASMTFAMGIGAVYFLNAPSASDPLFVNQNTQSPANSTKSTTSNNLIRKDGLRGSRNSFNAQSSSLATSQDDGYDALSQPSTYQANRNRQGGASYVSQDNATAFVKEEDQLENPFASAQSVVRRRPTSKLYETKKPVIVVPDNTSEPDPGMLLLARLEDEERKLNADKKKPTSKERTWASVGFGAGTFNPQSSSSPPPLQKGMGITADGGGTKTSSSSPSSGSSYSVGVGMAGKVSKRIVLQGGISYLTQNAEFTSSSAEGKSASLNEFAVNSNEMVPTSPYKVNNNLQYLSVPMQAGYVVLDRNFGIQLNGGVATDLFLQSTLSADNGLAKVTQGAGSDSPYRTVNFTGLVGTEFSYKVADHYRIAVSPGMRYALNSIYKSDIDTELSAMTFDVSVRFRYIIK